MNPLEVQPQSRVPRGVVRVASDKSITQRAVLLAAAAEGRSELRGPLDAQDTRAVRAAAQKLGARIEDQRGAWIVEGVGRAGFDRGSPRNPIELDLRNSGTGARLLLGLLGGQGVCARITGDESLRRRPMARVVAPLRAMGVRCDAAAQDRLPITIDSRPPLRPFRGEIDVASAQVKSAILLAALEADGSSEVREPEKSRDHTERMLPVFGVPVKVGERSAELEGPAALHAAELAVPADPSSAAFFAAIAALYPGSEITFPDLLANPLRTAFFGVLERMGAHVEWRDRCLRHGEMVGTCTVRGDDLRGVELSGQDIPSVIDELPVLAVLAALARGETVVRNAGELRVKESDRIEAMEQGLSAMGADFESLPDGFRIRGGKHLSGARIATRLDHRIAMAHVVAALRARTPTRLDDRDCIDVSYPDFLRDLLSLWE